MAAITIAGAISPLTRMTPRPVQKMPATKSSALRSRPSHTRASAPPQMVAAASRIASGGGKPHLRPDDAARRGEQTSEQSYSVRRRPSPATMRQAPRRHPRSATATAPPRSAHWCRRHGRPAPGSSGTARAPFRVLGLQPDRRIVAGRHHLARRHGVAWLVAIERRDRCETGEHAGERHDQDRRHARQRRARRSSPSSRTPLPASGAEVSRKQQADQPWTVQQ